MENLRAVALEILQQHGQVAEDLHYLGAGEQSVCYGTGELALLINFGRASPDVRKVNPYLLQQWLATQALRAEVKTAEILAVGDHPHRYALMRRAYGINAAAAKGASPARVAAWYRRMGAEVRKINRVQTTGFGEFVPGERPGEQGGYRGRYATWGAYLDACVAKYLFMGALSPQARRVRDLFLAQGIVSGADLEKIAARLEAAKRWSTRSVLIHYDNRLANLIVDGEAVVIVDWGLAYAGIGLPQEMIKVTEAPPAPPEHDLMAAFLQGYGVAEQEWPEVTARATLMLVLDGLAMSYAWAGDSAALADDSVALADGSALLRGIRRWLQSIRRICDAW
jgi:hypothetical protein